MRYGYARVSSKTQDYSGQADALKAAGCERIFSEKRSGKSEKDRPEFNKLMRTLVPGDTIVVSKLDRLARSSRDLHNILHEVREQCCDGGLVEGQPRRDHALGFPANSIEIAVPDGGIEQVELPVELLPHPAPHRFSICAAVRSASSMQARPAR